MKPSTMLRISSIALAAFLLTASGVLADESKNISDGAAKGQATEGTFHPQTQGKNDTPGGGKGQPGMAVKGSGVPKNTTVAPAPGGRTPPHKVNKTTTRSNTQHN